MNKKVIVTGGAGFIGSYVVEDLLKKGFQIRVLDNYSKEKYKKSSIKQIEFIKADLRDKSSHKYFKGFEKCIHLAALIGGIGYFHKFQADILNQNNEIYSTVFEACRKLDYKKIVYVSSSMVFESTNIFPSKEKDLSSIPMPKTSYGFSKLIGEIYCKAYYEQYKLPYIIVRPFNAYGINEFPSDKIVGMSHVIPDLILKTLRKQTPLKILGSGRQTRSFTHASDIARGIVLALESKLTNNDFNLGDKKETKILDLAKEIHFIIRPKDKFNYKLIEGYEYDVAKRVPDYTRARKLLKWKPSVKLEDELPKIIKWIKNRKNIKSQ